MPPKVQQVQGLLVHVATPHAIVSARDEGTSCRISDPSSVAEALQSLVVPLQVLSAALSNLRTAAICFASYLSSAQPCGSHLRRDVHSWTHCRA